MVKVSLDETMERRRYLRLKVDAGTSVAIDLGTSWIDEFLPVLKGLVLNAAFGGCEILCVTTEPLQDQQLCRIKVYGLEPIVARIIWLKSLDVNVVKFGVEYFNDEMALPEAPIVLADNRPILRVLSSFAVFEGVDITTIERLLPQFQVKSFKEGEVVITPGESNCNLYLLLSGHLRVYLTDCDDSVIHGEMGFTIFPGECIGEMSILENRPVSAYVVADDDCQLLEIHETIFWHRLVYTPRFVRNLLKELSGRIRRSDEVVLSHLEKRLKFEQLQKDLKAASEIQANILPQMPMLADHPTIDVFARVIPAKDVGGDFFDCFTLDERHICIAVGDVSGKGIPAALFMIRTVTLLRLMISTLNPLDSILTAINSHLCKNNKNFMFVTLFVGILDIESGQLTYVNGGHNAPFFRQSTRSFEALTMPEGAALGIFEQARYRVATLTLQPEDTLVVYTDGVTEAENETMEFFTTVKTREVLNTIPPIANAMEVVNTLEGSVLTFSEQVSQSDDITILALRYRG